MSNKFKSFFHEIWLFLKSGIFLRNLVGMVAVVGLILFLTVQWLKSYTRHGKTLQIADYINMDIDEARELASNNDIVLRISDSVFHVNKPGGVITSQDPKPFSRVKKDRTIWLKTTAYIADEVKLPGLAGGNDSYVHYSDKIKRIGEIESEITERVFNSKLEENTILEVIYDGKKITKKIYDKDQSVMIPRGATLQFIVSERSGSFVAIPKLECQKFDAAQFAISNYNLNIGSVIPDGTVTNKDKAYVWKQNPAYREGDEMRIGEQIDLYLTQNKPSNCGKAGANPNKPIAPKPVPDVERAGIGQEVPPPNPENPENPTPAPPENPTPAPSNSDEELDEEDFGGG